MLVNDRICIICYRPVGSVGKLQVVQEWVGSQVGLDKAFKRLHDHTGEGVWLIVIRSCVTWVFRDGEDGAGFEAGQ